MSKGDSRSPQKNNVGPKRGHCILLRVWHICSVDGSETVSKSLIIMKFLTRKSKKLSFKFWKKDRSAIKITEYESCVDCNTINNKQTFLEDKYVLSTVSWYWPKLTGYRAEEMLTGRANGTFLVRRSSTAGYMFTVTYIIQGKVGNLRVQCKNGLFCLLFQDHLQPREPTLQKLITRLMDVSSKESFLCGLKRVKDGVSSNVPLVLDKTVGRDISLREHCRRVIMRAVTDPGDVLQFDIPESLKVFLLELSEDD